METCKLDNPAWHSLQEAHTTFALQYAAALFYQPGVCPFGGYNDAKSVADAIKSYAAITNDFYVIGEKPAYSNDVILNKELICDQMLLDKKIAIEPGFAEEIVPLNTNYSNELFKLVNLVQPGYFKWQTHLTGSYFGIFKQGQLVAAAGERMKMHDYTEISAVVTHPQHTGKGFAKQLVAYTANKIFEENKLPYLHVAETNKAAIHLYEQSGFVKRRKMSFWHFMRNNDA